MISYVLFDKPYSNSAHAFLIYTVNVGTNKKRLKAKTMQIEVTKGRKIG